MTTHNAEIVKATQPDLPTEYAPFKEKFKDLELIFDDAKNVEIIDTTTYEHVHKCEMAIADFRIAVEKKRKALNEDALKWQRENNGFAKEIMAFAEPKELILSNKKEAWKREQQRIKDEKAAQILKEENDRREAIRLAEEQKQKKIQARQQALNRTGAVIITDTGNEYYELGKVMILESVLLHIISDDDFELAIEQFQAEKAAIKERTERIERRKAAILKTGAIHNDNKEIDTYDLGEAHYEGHQIMLCDEETFSKLWVVYQKEAEKIKMAKEAEQRELEAKQKEIKKREMVVERKELIAKQSGATLDADGFYVVGNEQLNSADLPEMDNKTFSVNLTRLTKEGVRLKEMKAREEAAKKEAEEKKTIKRGIQRNMELAKYGCTSYTVDHHKQTLIELGEWTEKEFAEAVSDWKAKYEKETKAAEERKAALAPDLEKLQTFVKDLRAIKCPACESTEAKQLVNMVMGQLQDTITDLEDNLKTIA